MDWTMWAVEFPQVCCVLPTLCILLLMVVSFSLKLILLPFEILIAVIEWMRWK
jgi:hypothetical protein